MLRDPCPAAEVRRGVPLAGHNRSVLARRGLTLHGGL
jgi:hypothetical protein